LVWTSFEFAQAAHGEERNAESTRSLAAQLMAIRLLKTMSSHDVVRSLTLDFEIPVSPATSERSSEEPSSETYQESERLWSDHTLTDPDPEVAEPLLRQDSNNNTSMSALEIAIAGEALKFLASPIVQQVLQDIWKGNIVLWGDLDVNASTARKKATIYTWGRSMWVGYARLRVPRYRFAFQVANFSILLILFLMTLRQSDRDHISVQEVFLDIWFLGFAYAELGSLSEKRVW
jgi:hypothetical protein